jgi:hypothetical protein
VNQLRNLLSSLTSSFVTRTLNAIRAAPLEEIAALTGRPTAMPLTVRGKSRHSTRTARPNGPLRSDEIEQSLSQLLALLTKNRGAQGGKLRTKLGLSKGQFLRVVTAGIDKKKVRRVGEKRGVRYFTV